jgi:hypothetical protein
MAALGVRRRHARNQLIFTKPIIVRSLTRESRPILKACYGLIARLDPTRGCKSIDPDNDATETD